MSCKNTHAILSSYTPKEKPRHLFNLPLHHWLLCFYTIRDSIIERRSQCTLEVVALCYQHFYTRCNVEMLILECHNSYKLPQSLFSYQHLVCCSSNQLATVVILVFLFHSICYFAGRGSSGGSRVNKVSSDGKSCLLPGWPRIRSVCWKGSTN